MNDVRRRLQWPAIGLIIVGTLNVLSGLVLILGRLVSIVKGPDRVITDEDRRLGYMVAGIFFPIVSLISIAVSPIIIFGGVQMLGARRYSIALWAAILALIPLTSVCCIPGIPIGIWALIVLRHPEVRAGFAGYQMPGRQQHQI
jgi:type IV secretory pathway protease TraF